MRTIPLISVTAWLICIGPSPLAAQPMFNIIDIGVLSGGQFSQGFRISPGGIATGRAETAGGTSAFTWTTSGGIVGLPNLSMPNRPFGSGAGVNDNGVVVGTGSVTPTGDNPVPVIWQNGVATLLPLPAGIMFGNAFDINNSNIAVGISNPGSAQVGCIFSGGTATIITQTTANGSFISTANAINNAGRIVGQGCDPNNLNLNVGYVLDPGQAQAYDVGSLPGANGALCFDVSEAGHITGASMLNQNPGVPFIWTQASGISPVPLPVGTSNGSGFGVNSLGHVVGTATSASSIPFYFDGTTTYRLADLIPANSGWDLLNNFESTALGISDAGVIVGYGLFMGQSRGFAMVPVPEPTSGFLLGCITGTMWVMNRRKRKTKTR